MAHQPPKKPEVIIPISSAAMIAPCGADDDVPPAPSSTSVYDFRLEEKPPERNLAQDKQHTFFSMNVNLIIIGW